MDYNKKCVQNRKSSSANLRPLLKNNMTKISVIKLFQNCTRTTRSGVVGLLKYLNECKAGYYKIFGYAKTPLLMVLVQFWDHFLADTFVTILLKRSQVCTGTIRNDIFKDILFLGSFLIVIPIVIIIVIVIEGVELSIRNFVVFDQCTQGHNKKHQPTCLDVFDTNWQALNWRCHCKPCRKQ